MADLQVGVHFHGSCSVAHN